MWDKNNRVEYLEANLQSLLNWKLGLPRAKLAKVALENSSVEHIC